MFVAVLVMLNVGNGLTVTETTTELVQPNPFVPVTV